MVNTKKSNHSNMYNVKLNLLMPQQHHSRDKKEGQAVNKKARQSTLQRN